MSDELTLLLAELQPIQARSQIRSDDRNSPCETSLTCVSAFENLDLELFCQCDKEEHLCPI